MEQIGGLGVAAPPICLSPSPLPRASFWRILALLSSTTKAREASLSMSGYRLGHYELIDEVGRGGGGTVWRARDTRLGREVAVKVLSKENSLDPHQRKRFLLEAQAASALNHPNIVSIHEMNQAGAQDYIVMEFVRGTPLSALIPPGGMLLEELLGVAVQIADALATAHGAGIVHRDIKPSNVMVDAKGRVRILDFGLAKLMRNASLRNAMEVAGEEPHTLQGVILGTIWYMSPEQASGVEVDARSDMFSFGSMLFEMATGRKPFVGENDLATLRRICSAPPPQLEDLRKDLPQTLRQLVYRLLEKEPSARYDGMAQVTEELQRIRGGSSAGTQLQTTVVRRRPAARWRKRWLIPVLGILAAVAAASAVPSVRHRAADWIRVGRGEWTGQGAYDFYVKGKKALERCDRGENRTQAMQFFRQALERDRNHALAYAGVAETKWRDWREQPDASVLAEARENAERAVRLGGHFAVAHAVLGIVQAESGLRQQGRDSLLRALDLDPRCLEAHYLLAVYSAETDDWDTAQRHVNKAIELAPGAWPNYHLQAFVHHRRGKYQEAIAGFQKALAAAPDNAPVLRDLATSYHHAGMYEEAASALQASLAIQPSHKAYNNLGTLRFFQGRYAEAAQLMEKATELGPTRYLTWGNLADAYRWTPGSEEKSKEAFQVALRLVQQRLDSHPPDASARSSMAVYLAKTGQVPEAMSVMESLPAAAVERADIQFKMAVVAELAGRRVTALDHLEHCLRIGYAVNEVEADPELSSLRRDIRYQRMLARTHSARGPK